MRKRKIMINNPMEKFDFILRNCDLILVAEGKEFTKNVYNIASFMRLTEDIRSELGRFVDIDVFCILPDGNEMKIGTCYWDSPTIHFEKEFKNFEI